MAADQIPPFESFYREQREDVFAFLVRALGAEPAEDAFQETFLRALRAYPRLEHGRSLRAWVFTIASRIAIDARRGQRPQGELPVMASEDLPPAYHELEHLVSDLPPTEQAAVVLRYGYDLAYEDIGAMLGSTPEAARQATSSGIRRLRKGASP